MPLQPLPKSNASADFLAMLLTVKFVDGLPLARFEYILDRHGVPVPRQTLARWVIGVSHLLQSLHNLMCDTLTDGPFLHVDETVVQVLKEDGKKPSSNSHMWVQTGGPVVIFDYDPSRNITIIVLTRYRGSRLGKRRLVLEPPHQRDRDFHVSRLLPVCSMLMTNARLIL